MIASFIVSLVIGGALAVALAPDAALAQSPPPAGAPSSAVTQIMPLTDGQVRGFLDAMDDMRTLPGASGAAADLSRPAAFAQALRVSGESSAILRKHGFKDTVDFQQVAYNAAMAYGVFRKGGKEAIRRELDASQAKQAQGIEKARQHLSPEQLKAMQAQMSAGMNAASAMRDVPDENVKLVERYKDRMAKLGRSGG